MTEAATTPAASADAAPSGRTCPKCDAAVGAEQTACPACGLATENMDGWAAQAEPPPPEVEAAWREVEAAWDDPEVHDRFCKAAARAESFAYAGRVYRQAARRRGADDPRAQAGLQRVRRMAEAAWLSRPMEALAADGPTPYRGAASLLLALVLLAGLGGLGFMIIRSLEQHHQAVREPARAPHLRVPPARRGQHWPPPTRQKPPSRRTAAHPNPPLQN